MPYQARAYPCVSSKTDQEYFYSPLDEMLLCCSVLSSIKPAGTHLYPWVERGILQATHLAREHNTMSRLESGLLDLKTSTLTNRPPPL